MTTPLSSFASRKIALPENDQLAALTVLLHSLPNLRMQVDALAVPNTGLGEHERIVQAIADWQRPECQARYLLVAGHNPEEKFAFEQSVDELCRRYDLLKTDGVIVQPYAEHTLQQAQWTAEQVAELGVTSVAVYAPHYHLLRAWLTYVQAIALRDTRPIPVLPAQVAQSPYVPMAQYLPLVVEKWELIAGEFDRIRKYAAKGDVANFESALQYIHWLWRHQLICSVD